MKRTPIYVYQCLPIGMYVHHTRAVPKETRRGRQTLLVLELHRVVSYHVVAGTQTWVL